MIFKRKKVKVCDFKYKIYWNDGSISEGEITNSKFPPSAIFLENKFVYFLAGKGACFNRDEIKQIEIFDLIEKEEK